MKDSKGAVVNNSTRISQKNGIPYIEFTPFDEFDWVTLHFFNKRWWSETKEYIQA